MRCRHHPHHFADIPVSVHVNYQLCMASLRSGGEKEDWEIAEEAVDEWTRRHNPDALAMAVTSGYQWKSLFLPDGTVLRTVFGGANHHCLVAGDRILYNEKSVSPSGFVNAVGGIRRNAWRCTWILLPDSKVWKLADTLRSRSRPRRTYTPVAADASSPTAQRAADTTPPAVAPVADAPLPAHTDGAAAADEADPTVPGATMPPAAQCGGDGCLGALLRQDLHRLLERLRRFDEKAAASRA